MRFSKKFYFFQHNQNLTDVDPCYEYWSSVRVVRHCIGVVADHQNQLEIQNGVQDGHQNYIIEVWIIFFCVSSPMNLGSKMSMEFFRIMYPFYFFLKTKFGIIFQVNAEYEQHKNGPDKLPTCKEAQA